MFQRVTISRTYQDFGSTKYRSVQPQGWPAVLILQRGASVILHVTRFRGIPSHPLPPYLIDTCLLVSYCVVVWHFCSREEMKQQTRADTKQALRYVFNDFNSSYELLSRPKRNTLYVQRLPSILSTVYKSVMKQGLMYVNALLLIKAVNVKGISHLFSGSSREEDAVLIAS